MAFSWAQIYCTQSCCQKEYADEKERLDVSTIAERLKLSQPYVSELIRRLEETDLVKVNYERGERGVRKICELAVEKVVIVVKP